MLSRAHPRLPNYPSLRANCPMVCNCAQKKGTAWRRRRHNAEEVRWDGRLSVPGSHHQRWPCSRTSLRPDQCARLIRQTKITFDVHARFMLPSRSSGSSMEVARRVQGCPMTVGCAVGCGFKEQVFFVEKKNSYARRQVGKKSVTAPETPNVRLTKTGGHALTRTEGGLNRPRAPARSHKRTFPDVSPTSWKRTIAGECNPTELSNARRTEDPGHGERLVLSQIPQERDGAGPPPSCHLECHHEEMAPGPGKQLGVPAALVLFRLVDGLSLPATPRHAPTRQRRRWCQWRLTCLPRMAVDDAGHLPVPRC